MKRILLLFLVTLNIVYGFSISFDPVDSDEKDNDTIRTLNLDEFVVTSSVKETNTLKRMPTAISILSPRMLESRQVQSLTSMSGMVPNFFIPNYGSKVSTPIYIRGVGARLGA
ncbi:MAG TPA: TonB-dependent receptor, partial [Bacteroidales bacterium]|nr:TonB-dependent receptor [Bacteroidales bacterium]